jgi:hypothetical protein
VSARADERGWVIVGPKPSRVEPEVAFLASFFVGLIFFVVGLFPAYVFEVDGRMDASERCPPPSASIELSYDPACAAALVARGPLYLGRGALALSFVLGAVAIANWSRVSGFRRPRVISVAVGLVYLAGWAVLLAWNATEGARLAQGDLGSVT